MTRRAAASAAMATPALILLPAPLQAQCALCRDALGAAPGDVTSGFFSAILLLVVAPYAVAAIAALTVSPAARASVAGWVRRRLSRTGLSSRDARS